MKTLSTVILMLFVTACSNMDWGRNRDTGSSGSSGSSYGASSGSSSGSSTAPSSDNRSDAHPGHTYEGGQK